MHRLVCGRLDAKVGRNTTDMLLASRFQSAPLAMTQFEDPACCRGEWLAEWSQSDRYQKGMTSRLAGTPMWAGPHKKHAQLSHIFAQGWDYSASGRCQVRRTRIDTEEVIHTYISRRTARPFTLHSRPAGPNSKWCPTVVFGTLGARKCASRLLLHKCQPLSEPLLGPSGKIGVMLAAAVNEKHDAVHRRDIGLLWRSPAPSKRGVRARKAFASKACILPLPLARSPTSPTRQMAALWLVARLARSRPSLMDSRLLPPPPPARGPDIPPAVLEPHPWLQGFRGEEAVVDLDRLARQKSSVHDDGLHHSILRGRHVGGWIAQAVTARCKDPGGPAGAPESNHPLHSRSLSSDLPYPASAQTSRPLVVVTHGAGALGGMAGVHTGVSPWTPTLKGARSAAPCQIRSQKLGGASPLRTSVLNISSPSYRHFLLESTMRSGEADLLWTTPFFGLMIEAIAALLPAAGMAAGWADPEARLERPGHGAGPQLGSRPPSPALVGDPELSRVFGASAMEEAALQDRLSGRGESSGPRRTPYV